MTIINTQYEDMLAAILERGTHKSDRTGTGTTSIFGYQTRFDLAKEFPLVTTKKVFTKGAAEELFWFLRGSINSHDLEAVNVNIWKEWADTNGELGPVYGYVWRYAPTHFYDDTVLIKVKSDPLAGEPFQGDADVERVVHGVGWLGENGGEGVSPRIHQLWEYMLDRCYDPAHPEYAEFGGAGVTVDPAWHSLERFAATLHRLPLYPLWKETMEGYVLNHSYYGAVSFSPNTSIFLPDTVDRVVRQNSGHTAAKVGKKVFMNEAAAADWQFGNTNTGELIELVEAPEGHLYRPQVYVDQVEWLLNEIKTNPDSRRLIISAWNPALVERQALPPCHTLFQFYVADGKLSCQLYQRSLDAVLGCPFNYVGYALFVHMLAQQTGLEVGEFIHTIGDAHIYDNHAEQVAEQLSREVRPMPTINLKKAEDLYSYKFSDIEIIGYDPHPAIKAPVAV